MVYYIYLCLEISVPNLLIISLPDEGYPRNKPCAQYELSTFYYYHFDNTSAGGLVVPEDIIRSEVSAWELIWFARYKKKSFKIPKG
jgi:hypothetical protein